MTVDLETRLRDALNVRAASTPDNPPPDVLSISGGMVTSSQSGPRRPARSIGIAISGGLVAAGIAAVVAVSGSGSGPTDFSPAASGESTESVQPTASTPVSVPSPTSIEVSTASTSPADTTLPEPSTTAGEASTPWHSAQLTEWIGTFDLADGDVAFDVATVGQTTIRIEKTASSLCVRYGPTASGCEFQDSGSTLQNPHHLVEGGGSFGNPNGEGTAYLRYWILPNGVEVALLDETGAPACAMQSVPVPQLGAATAWVCEASRPAAAGWKLRFTRDGVSHTKTWISNTDATID